MKNNKELWVFKYSPKNLDQLIATQDKKLILQKIINELPTCLLAGLPGTGKGAFMDILLKENPNSHCLKINASIENSIEDIRVKIKQFATAFDFNKKIIYLNEADRISHQGQDALRQLIEDTQSVTRFFFLANREQSITDAIKSRCGYHLDLNDPPKEQILSYCLKILKKEQIAVNNTKNIEKLIKHFYPDIRKIIGALQSNVQNGVISEIPLTPIETQQFSTEKNIIIKPMYDALYSTNELNLSSVKLLIFLLENCLQYNESVYSKQPSKFYEEKLNLSRNTIFLAFKELRDKNIIIMINSDIKINTTVHTWKLNDISIQNVILNDDEQDKKECLSCKLLQIMQV